jgi:hypothetical protein
MLAAGERPKFALPYSRVTRVREILEKLEIFRGLVLDPVPIPLLA